MRINRHMNQYFYGILRRGLRNCLGYHLRLMQQLSCGERANYVQLKFWSSGLYAHKMFGCIHTCLQTVSILGQLQIVEMPLYSPFQKPLILTREYNK